MKYLIVTADDFGLTKSINDGIVKGLKDGIVTTVAVIATGEAFDDCIEKARKLNLAEVGAHLCLTETAPLTSAEKIRSIVARNNRFYKHHTGLLLKYALRKVDPEHMYIELKAQLEKILRSGLRVTHLSSHEHIHMISGIMAIFVKLAREYSIPFIRYPQKENIAVGGNITRLYKKIAVTILQKGMDREIKGSGVRHSDNFFGFYDSGKIDEGLLMEMMGSLRGGATELVCHPGFLGQEVLERYTFHKNCERELYALMSPKVKRYIKNSGIILTSYGRLSGSPV